ncbi:MAG TPA: DUF72 domain-containing protein [Verrucomicrobiae bacterium]|nr:DUF72 domain-containing protein [Verrucomicrobiae bacterium]
MKPVYIGTSGWSYKGWEKAFYPPDIPKSRHFEYYLTQFPTVEINLTFYRLPTKDMTQDWHDKAPKRFLYTIKGSRFITHMKKLSHLGNALDKFFDRLKPLKKHMGPVLWQLPSMLKKDPARLAGFLEQLPANHRYAVEFRHPSWLDDDIFVLLRKHRVAHVSVSSGGMPMNLMVTTDFIYLRFHGLSGGAAHDYTSAELEPWARHICGNPGKTVFAYFNNDVNTRAPNNARTLMKMAGARAVKPFVNSQ